MEVMSPWDPLHFGLWAKVGDASRDSLKWHSTAEMRRTPKKVEQVLNLFLGSWFWVRSSGFSPRLRSSPRLGLYSFPPPCCGDGLGGQDVGLPWPPLSV